MSDPTPLALKRSLPLKICALNFAALHVNSKTILSVLLHHNIIVAVFYVFRYGALDRDRGGRFTRALPLEYTCPPPSN